MRSLFVGLFLVLSFGLADAKVPESLFLREPPPVALTKGAELFLRMEQTANPILSPESLDRDQRPFWIEHLEIPLSFLEENKAFDLDPEIRKSLVFERDGKSMVRWILNPEDTLWGNRLKASLAERGFPVVTGRYFIGYLTASRSCIVQDPRSGIVFSVKSSTNEVLGTWKEKRETVRAAKASRLMSDYLSRNYLPRQNETLSFIPETLSFSYGPGDQAIVIRQYEQFRPQAKTFVIPAFAALHKTVGTAMANGNEGSSPQEFWQTHLAKNLGRAQAELLLNFGLIYNSPHPQNFLIEVNESLLPTGRIFIRDFGDSDLVKELLEARHGREILELYKDFSHNKIYSEKDLGKLRLTQGMFHMPGDAAERWWATGRDRAGFHAVHEMAFRDRFLGLSKTVEPQESSKRFFPFDIHTKNYDKGYVFFQLQMDQGSSWFEKWTSHLRLSSRARCETVFLGL